MNIKSILKKEGIEVISSLDILQVSLIANSISNKLISAFSEHIFNKNNLYNSLSNINMYICNMPEDSSGAKYFYKTNTIYFNKSLTIKEMTDLAIHECIHFIQELKDNKNNIVRLGLYDFNSGLGLNEAAVQFMTSIANKNKIVYEKYYNIDLQTISPNYYPLECALINQVVYFTDSYPLFHSTLYSDDVFKNTFISKSNKKTYEQFIYNLDLLLALENNLDFILKKLQITNSMAILKSLNSKASYYKQEINCLFFETQNLIIENFFINELNRIYNIKEINSFQKKLYNFKNLVGSSNIYTFYNDFYCKILAMLEKKQVAIENFNKTNIYGEKSNELFALTLYSEKLSLIQKLTKKFFKLLHLKNDIV